MKKIIVILSLLTLCACAGANSSSEISKGSDVLFKGPDVTYTKADLYKSLKVSSSDAIVENIVNNIAKKYDVDTEAIEKEAQDMIDEYVSNGYESYIVTYYGSLDTFKNSYINGKILEELSSVYVKEHYDDMVADDTPVKMQVASFLELAEAEKFLEEVNNGSTFDMAALNNNTQDQPQSAVFTDSDSSLPFEVKEYINSNDSLGLSPIITSITSSDGAEVSHYYVINVESRNPEEFKDDYISLAASKVETDTLYEYLFTKHKVEFFDQDLYNLLSSKYEVLK